MMSLTKSDFSKICRICLKQPDNLISILNSEILNMFHTCTEVKIENNEFPENICPSCLDKLNTAYTFHQQCEHSDNILHQIVEYDDKFQLLAKHDDENQMFIENDANDLHESKEMIFEDNKLLDGIDKNNTNYTQNEWESDPFQEPELEMSNCQKSTPRQETNDEEFSHLDKSIEHTETTNHEVTPAHVQNHDQLTCHDCGRTFLNIRGLKRHILMHLNGRSLTCTKCFKTFIKYSHLKTHERTIHAANNDQPYTCTKCFKTFWRICNLRKHKRIVHKIENETNDLHESKEMIFKMKSAARLQNHDQFTCHDCGRTFLRMSGLKIHSRTHLNGRSLTCTKCFKTFTRMSNLRTHQRTVHANNDQPYTCTKCSRTFRRIGNLRTHERGVHKIQIAEHTKNSEENQKENETDDFHESKEIVFEENKILVDLDGLKNINDTKFEWKNETLQEPKLENMNDCQKSPYRHETNNEEFSHLDKSVEHTAPNHEVKPAHTQNHDQLICHDCGRTFLNGRGLKKHRQMHLNARSLTCKICFKTFTRIGNLRTHERTVHKIQNAKQTKNSEENQIENEMVNLHESKGMIFEENNVLDDSHENYKSDIQNERKSDTIQESTLEKNDCQKSPVRCETSNGQFLHLNKLVEHTKTNHKVKSVGMQNRKQNCRYCDKTFMGMRELTKHHSQVHSNDGCYICTECSRTFSGIHSIKKHIKSVHETILRTKKLVKLIRQKCDICQKEVKYLKAHKEVHLTGDNFQCEKCSKYFATEAKLKCHMIHTHEKRYVKPALCSVCGKETANKSDLDRHMQIHTVEKPFKCDKCDKSFRYKFNFVTHKTTHSNERPFICNICPKRFKTKLSLKKHTFLHTGKRPHVCHICSKSFPYHNHLTGHIMRAH